VPFVVPRLVGRHRKIFSAEDETVHDAQAKMYPVKQEQEVIVLGENFEVGHQW
jgi:hypothetical protein